MPMAPEKAPCCESWQGTSNRSPERSASRPATRSSGGCHRSMNAYREKRWPPTSRAARDASRQRRRWNRLRRHWQTRCRAAQTWQMNTLSRLIAGLPAAQPTSRTGCPRS
ncbi:Uncharacterised protein [Mycobacteroides abscessus subsp. abscessus]|nr:Uncharacterised protein [Mycobacteroides abscessus subsp. abscessus]